MPFIAEKAIQREISLWELRPALREYTWLLRCRRDQCRGTTSGADLRLDLGAYNFEIDSGPIAAAAAPPREKDFLFLRSCRGPNTSRFSRSEFSSRSTSVIIFFLFTVRLVFAREDPYKQVCFPIPREHKALGRNTKQDFLHNFFEFNFQK